MPFQILKDDPVKVLHSICQQIWKTQQWPQDWKRSVFIPIPKKGNAKECSNYQTIALISHASEVMFKILQARLWQYVNQELLDVQTGFRRGREARDQTANFHGSVIQLCLTFCDPRDCSPSGVSLHGIFQARILEWVAISYSNIHWDYRKSKKMSENHLLLVH